MKRLLALALAVALAGCAADERDGWVPTPGAPLAIGDTVTAAVPPVAGCPQQSITSLDGKPTWKVTDLPTPTTATINPGVLPGDALTVERVCLVPYRLK